MRFLSVMLLYQYHVFKQEILYFTIKEQDATCRSYFLIIGYLLYSEYLSQLYILNVMNSNKYLDLQKERTKSFEELKRCKEEHQKSCNSSSTPTPRDFFQHIVTSSIYINISIN